MTIGLQPPPHLVRAALLALCCAGRPEDEAAWRKYARSAGIELYEGEALLDKAERLLNANPGRRARLPNVSSKREVHRGG